MMANTTLIGLGSYYAQDQLAWIVCDRLIQRQQRHAVDVIKSTPVELPELFRNRQHVILLDACLLPDEYATIHVIDINDLQNSPLALQSSHGLGVSEMLSLSRTLGCLPVSLSIMALSIQLNVELTTVVTDSYLTRIENTIDDVIAGRPV